MKKYRTFEVTEDKYNLKGSVDIRMDEDETSIFKKMRSIGFRINLRKNKLIWWDDDYIEVINKRTENTVAFLETIYA